jgi:hypothetical protein
VASPLCRNELTAISTSASARAAVARSTCHPRRQRPGAVAARGVSRSVRAICPAPRTIATGAGGDQAGRDVQRQRVERAERL